MNREDFQRNFSRSYFGLIITDTQRQVLESQLANKGWDLTTGQVLPCCNPAVLSGRTCAVRAVVRAISDPMQFGVVKATIAWAENIDEDSSYMRAGVPPAGMIQGRYTAWYASRKPVRDTPRGFCPRATAMPSINRNVLRDAGVDNGNEYHQVYRVYNRIKYPWEEACTRVSEGDLIGAVVDRHVAVGVDGKNRHSQIFYKGLGSVGFVDGQIPYVFEEFATAAVREYIYKVSGRYPEVR